MTELIKAASRFIGLAAFVVLTACAPAQAPSKTPPAPSTSAPSGPEATRTEEAPPAGDITPRDDDGSRTETSGVALLEKACKRKDPMACNDLGAAYSEGKNGAASVDHARARSYYEKSCKLDDGVGCFNLGNVFRLGEGTSIDLRRALDEFQRACDLGAAQGCTEAAIIHIQGEGVPRDVDKGMELLEKGCQLGSQVACKNRDIIRNARKP